MIATENLRGLETYHQRGRHLTSLSPYSYYIGKLDHPYPPPAAWGQSLCFFDLQTARVSTCCLVVSAGRRHAAGSLQPTKASSFFALFLVLRAHEPFKQSKEVASVQPLTRLPLLLAVFPLSHFTAARHSPHHWWPHSATVKRNNCLQQKSVCSVAVQHVTARCRSLQHLVYDATAWEPAPCVYT